MSLRYVWSKWDKSSKRTGYKETVTNKSGTMYANSSSYRVWKNYTFDSSTGKFTCSTYAGQNDTGYFCWIRYTTSQNATTSGTTMYYGKVSGIEYPDPNYPDYSTGTYTYTKVYTATAVYTDVQGSTQYDNVSGTQNAYNSNGVTGDYWYVLLGSDTIDPSAVTLTGEVKAGSTVNLTITPSATIAYGGTVTYTVQTTTDGDNWYDAGTTTDTTMTLTVPEAAAWNARVIASDDTGFTSTTAVYANGSEDLVSVINVGFIPKSGWIGYKNTKNLLLVSATGTAGETVNISASLDGTQVITGSTTSGVSYQLALTDEQFAALTEGKSHTLTVTAQYATSGTSETRTYTFRKFTYDETSEGGVMEGAARAIRAKNGSESTILGSKIPYEIIQIGAGGTATEADVKAGQTFFTEEGWKTGTSTAGEVKTITTTATDAADTVTTLTLPSGYKSIIIYCILAEAKYNTYKSLEAYIEGTWYAAFTGSGYYPKHSSLSGNTLTLKQGSMGVGGGGDWTIKCFVFT